MRKRIFLHIGPPKTATTYLQRVLELNAGGLREQGVAVINDQVALRDAASELIGRTAHPSTPLRPGSWASLRNQIIAEKLDVVMSCERFSLLLAPHARTIIESLPEADVHVLVTLRDAAAHLPSRWQERVKNGGTETWTEFCGMIADDPGFRQRMLRMVPPLAAWSEVLAADRVKIITVPAPGTDQHAVLDRLCTALGIDVDGLTHDTDVRNPSLGLAEVELVRRLNVQLGHQLPRPVQRREIRDFMIRDVLTGRSSSSRLQPSAAAFAAARAEVLAAIDLVTRGAHPVHGDLEELVTAQAPPSAPGPPTTEAEVVSAAVDALGAFSQRSHQAHRQVAALAGASRSKPNRGRRNWLSCPKGS